MKIKKFELAFTKTLYTRSRCVLIVYCILILEFNNH